ncbi:MAG: Na/Pi cotransporter family protein [Deltaproteobacteria bacterium]|nr:Na/Pi cotransporter family protein [Deltaproteobacteria bacterium]
MTKTNWLFVFFGFLGGIGILLYGIQVMGDGLQKILGRQLRTLLESITKKPVLGVLAGILITILFQSSTATTVILVGLTNAAVITLRQSMPVILGADIGTTVTAQLIALKLTELSLLIVGLGAPIAFFAKKDRHHRIGQALTGFGLLFLGLKIIGDSLKPLQDSPAFTEVLLFVSRSPLLAIAASAAVTFLIHSSAAVMGIIMVLAGYGLISLNAAIYLLLGTNVGTSFTALLASIGSRREAQRVALAHLLSKLGGTIIFLPFVPWFGSFLVTLTHSVTFQVANAHTLFNLGMAAVLLPFVKPGARFLEWLLPDKRLPELEPKFLREEVITMPSLAIGLAQKETIRISAGTLRMIWYIKRALETGNPDYLERIIYKEKIMDALCRAAVDYLTRVLRQSLNQDEQGYAMGLIRILDSLEKINDIMERDIRYRIETKLNRGVHFSSLGKEELMTLVESLIRGMRMTHKALVKNNLRLAEEAVTCHPRNVALILEFRQNHIHRLTEGIKESEESSNLHLELLNSFQHFSEMVRNIDLIIFDELSKGIRRLDERPPQNEPMPDLPDDETDEENREEEEIRKA